MYLPIALRYLTVLLLGLLLSTSAKPAEDKDKDCIPLFDGHSLHGWVNVNCAPSTFYVRDGQIITTGKPTGYLRTTKQYENFIAEFDWMHVPPAPGAVGNSGFFVWADPLPAVGTGYTRGIECQVLVNLTYKNKKGQIIATSQGDLFSIWGATCIPDRPHPNGWARCLPSGNYCKGANQWNHYRVEANNGVIKLAVNGHVVSGLSHCKPRKGYLALESEGSECHFKNLKIKELPNTHPAQDEIADVAHDFRNLYTGLDLSGWEVERSAKEHWQPHDGRLHYDGHAQGDHALRTAKEFGDAAFRVDFRFPNRASKPCTFVLCHGRDHGEETSVQLTIGADGQIDVDAKGSAHQAPSHIHGRALLHPAGQWNRLRVMLTGKMLRVVINGPKVKELRVPDAHRKGTFDLRPGGEMDFANLFVRDLHGGGGHEP